MKPQSHSLILVIVISITSVTCGAQYHQRRPVCACICPFNNEKVCNTIKDVKAVADANAEQLRLWAEYRSFIQQFSKRWRAEISNIVETMIDDYISNGKLHQKPENIIQMPEDGMQNDSNMDSRLVEDDSDLAKNVSSLLEKVEMVESRTNVVEKELNTEKRVRRDLEEKVNMTHFSLVSIEDQLHNVSAPVDAMVTQVEMRLYASMEDLNKTIYEDHLKKLYYKVDGVAYKDEMKKLDERLETVEVELHDGNNSSLVSKLAEDLKDLQGNVYILNNSIGDIVVPRIQTLNNSIGDVLIPRIEILEVETVRKDAAEELEDKMTNLLNDTEMFKLALVDVLSNVQDVQNLEKKFQNFSEKLTKSLEAMQRQIEYLKNETFVKEIVQEPDDAIEIIGALTDRILEEDATDDTTEFAITDATELETTTGEHRTLELETTIGDLSTLGLETTKEGLSTLGLETTTEELPTFDPFIITTVMDRSRLGGELDDDSTLCDVPAVNDPHLLVDVVQNDEGKQILKFGCKPIGRYIVPHVPIPARCEKGSWRNPVSSCTRLPSVTEIESLAEELLKEHPCDTGSGEFPDATNCTQFFKCAHGKLTVIPCPHGLQFNAMLRVCDYPRIVECYSEKSKHVEELQALIPPIHIEPDNLDKTNSHLATGGAGELIVHPRSSFTLHCLYPENIYGDPIWKVTYLHSGLNSRVLTPQIGVNRLSLTITAAKEEDSGTYRCLTPFGLKHDVEVIVKDVICPAFATEEDYEDVFYRPTPEGELRILGTTAEVQCEEGHKVIVQCMANGAWSQAFPSEEGCTPKRRSDGKMWNCKSLDVSKHSDLIIERNDDEKIVTFKCAGRRRLVGNTFTRCLDDGSWSHTSLPFCKK